MYDWCHRTICEGLKLDQQDMECSGFIGDIWIGKPVIGRKLASDGSGRAAPQRLRYAHVRFQHEIFKTLMMTHAKSERFDGSSRPVVSL